MPVVTNTLTAPGGGLLASVPVLVRLVASTTREAGGFVTATDAEVIGYYSTRTDTAGVWSLTLTANSLITPSGTVYEITERPPGRPAVVYTVSVPAGVGPYAVGDILADPPGALLTAAAAAALAVETAARIAADEAAATLASGTFGRIDQRLAPMQRQTLGFAKGALGTGGKIPVALRFDDYQDAFEANVLPLLVARRLPASLVQISRIDTNPWWTTALAPWSDIVAWNKLNGIEIWSHGTDHNDPTPAGYAGLVREIVTSKQEIEAQGLRVMGWAMPGTFPLTAEVPFGSTLSTVANWDTDAGRLLQATYALVETDMTGRYRTQPSQQFYGLGHTTCSDSRTVAQTTKDELDIAVRMGLGLEIMCHAGNLGLTGHLPLAEFVILLDYLVTLRDAGTIEIVTPSSLPFCDPDTSRRMDLIYNSGFELANTPSGPTVGQWANVDGTIRSIQTVADAPGGVSGKVLRITSSTTTVQQAPIRLLERGLGGMTMILEAKCRAIAGASAVGRLLVQDRLDTTRLNIDYQPAVTSAWGTLRQPFTIPLVTDQLTIGVGRVSGGTGQVEFDDVHVYVA